MPGIKKKRKVQPTGSGNSPTVVDGVESQIRRRKNRTEPLAVDVQWLDDDRTAAWAELWGRIFREVFTPEGKELPDTKNKDENDESSENGNRKARFG